MMDGYKRYTTVYSLPEAKAIQREKNKAGYFAKIVQGGYIGGLISHSGSREYTIYLKPRKRKEGSKMSNWKTPIRVNGSYYLAAPLFPTTKAKAATYVRSLKRKRRAWTRIKKLSDGRYAVYVRFSPPSK